MSLTHARYTQAVFCLIGLAGGAAAGLQLARWTARARPSPGDRPPVYFPKTPDPAVTATWEHLFDASRLEIWLSAGRLESEALLRSLDAAQKRGVAVHMTLSPLQNPVPNTGVRAWLRDKTSLRDIRISPKSFDGAACAVDHVHSIVTAQGLLAAISNSSDAGIFLYSADPGIARALEGRLREQYAEAKPEVPP